MNRLPSIAMLSLLFLTSCGGGKQQPDASAGKKVVALPHMPVDTAYELVLYGAPYSLHLTNSDHASHLVLTHDTGQVFDLRIDRDTVQQRLEVSTHFEHPLEKQPEPYTYEGLRYVTHRGRYLLLEVPMRAPDGASLDYIRLQIDYLKQPGKLKILGLSNDPLLHD